MVIVRPILMLDTARAAPPLPSLTAARQRLLLEEPLTRPLGSLRPPPLPAAGLDPYEEPPTTPHVAERRDQVRAQRERTAPAHGGLGHSAHAWLAPAPVAHAWHPRLPPAEPGRAHFPLEPTAHLKPRRALPPSAAARRPPSPPTPSAWSRRAAERPALPRNALQARRAGWAWPIAFSVSSLVLAYALTTRLITASALPAAKRCHPATSSGCAAGCSNHP